jgi:hypothetical protein
MCKHFVYSEGGRGYSERTPGWDFSMGCGLHHWEFDTRDTSKKEFVSYLKSANTCKDYEKCTEEE